MFHDILLILPIALAYLAGGATMCAAAATYLYLTEVDKALEAQHQTRPHTSYRGDDLKHVEEAVYDYENPLN